MAQIVVTADNVDGIAQSLHRSFLSYSGIEKGTREEYLFLGCALGGETGELQDQIKKVARDGNAKPSSERLDKIRSEVGDVVAYLEHICRAFQIDPWACYVEKTSELVNERRPTWAMGAINQLELELEPALKQGNQS